MSEKEKEIILRLPIEDIVNMIIVMETALWLLKEQLNVFEVHIAEINKLKSISDSNELETEKRIVKLENKTELLKSLYFSRRRFVESLKVKINDSGIDIGQEVLKHIKENGSPWRIE